MFTELNMQIRPTGKFTTTSGDTGNILTEIL